MDVIGRYIEIWVTRDEMEAVFGFDQASTAELFMLGGTVVAESAGIGLWIQLDKVTIGGESEDLLPDVAKEKPTRLVRWDFIRAAEAFDERPAAGRSVDFRPQAA